MATIIHLSPDLFAARIRVLPSLGRASVPTQGGNSELTKVDEVIDANGVKIMGEANILNKLPVSASNLYSKNMFNFINNLYDKDKKNFDINLEDEIIEKTMVK